MKFVGWSPGGMDWVPVADGRVRHLMGDGEVSVIERTGVSVGDGGFHS